MSRFAIRYPYLIIVICLITCVVGVTSLMKMPVDLFPAIKIPVVVVATFFSGMPPEQVETDITGRFERFFTLASGVDHIESRSLPGVSLIKIYFQPGFNADSAVTSVANLAMANLRKLPQHPAARGFEIRRIEFTGLFDHLEGRRPQRSGTARSRPIQHPQSGGQRARTPCRSRSAGDTGKSWFMWTRSNSNRTN